MFCFVKKALCGKFKNPIVQISMPLWSKHAANANITWTAKGRISFPTKTVIYLQRVTLGIVEFDSLAPSYPFIFLFFEK